jgi:peptidoglycan L-alanyl-D-glutamate endopeptidase CwlK
MMMDARSETNIIGVQPALVAVVREAWDAMPIDGVRFVVTEGLRTLARQKQLVAAGASRTMQSRHLTGDAVDLAAKVGTMVRWELNVFYKLALAMRNAAVSQGTRVTWGACWRPLNDLGGTEDAIAQAVAAYGERCKAAGTRPFVDGPHFELTA